jgi:hypothetical protein
MRFYPNLEKALESLKLGFDTKNKSKALVTVKYLSKSGNIHETDFEVSTKEELLSSWKHYINNNPDVFVKGKDYVNDVSFGFTDEQEKKHERLQIYLSLFLKELMTDNSKEPECEFVSYDDKLKSFVETPIWNDTYYNIITTLVKKGYDIYVPSIKADSNDISYVSEKFK